ncbi:unnamed protein product [Calypogeia fissa]
MTSRVELRAGRKLNIGHVNKWIVFEEAQEGGTQESSRLGGLFERSTNHLSKAHLLVFQQWHWMSSLADF